MNDEDQNQQQATGRDASDLTHLLPSTLVLTGSYMMEGMRTKEVQTVEELLDALEWLLDLSPTTEVSVTRAG